MLIPEKNLILAKYKRGYYAKTKYFSTDVAIHISGICANDK